MTASNNAPGVNAYATAYAINVGDLDRGIRYVLSAALVGQLFVADSPLGWHLYAALLGVLLFASALCAWDPVYQLLRWQTTGVEISRFGPADALGKLPGLRFIRNRHASVGDTKGTAAPANQADYNHDDERVA